jgi:putative ABC transport system substrate-binding protein
MRRRDFVAGLIGVAGVWSRPAQAQQPRIPVVGFLNAGSAQGYALMSAAFEKGLGERGYVNGRNITVEYRWAEIYIPKEDGKKRPISIPALTPIS